MKRIEYILLFMLVGFLMPLAIWVAGGSALYHSIKEAKSLRKALAPA